MKKLLLIIKALTFQYRSSFEAHHDKAFTVELWDLASMYKSPFSTTHSPY